MPGVPPQTLVQLVPVLIITAFPASGRPLFPVLLIVVPVLSVPPPAPHATSGRGLRLVAPVAHGGAGVRTHCITTAPNGVAHATLDERDAKVPMQQISEYGPSAGF